MHGFARNRDGGGIRGSTVVQVASVNFAFDSKVAPVILAGQEMVSAPAWALETVR